MLAMLAALALGISHAPAEPIGCTYVVPVIALSNTNVIAGNMRTVDGGCIVWLSSAYVSALRRRDACQIGAHEAGHLGGLAHVLDRGDVMHSPFIPMAASFCKTTRKGN